MILFELILFMIYIVSTQTLLIDDDIYSVRIYQIPQAKQAESINEEHIKCLENMIYLNYSIDILTIDNKCPVSWDGIMCWPETEAGKLVSAPCPNYVDSFQINGSVTKRCTINGTWFIKDNNTWTNYSDCKSKVDSVAFKQFENIEKIGQVGYAISIFSLVIAIIILCSFRRLRCNRNYIHLNLFFAFFFRAIFHYPSSIQPTEKILCRILRVIYNYFTQASFQSVFTEAIYMHNMIFYHTFDSSKINTPIYIALCWVVPGFVIAIWSLLRYKYNNVYCWDLSVDKLNRDFWFLNANVILLTLVNSIIFIILTCSLCSKMNSRISTEREKYKKLARSICILVIVFGVYNVVFVPVEIICAIADNVTAKKTELIKLYFHHIFNSCQGFLVSLLLCFVNGEVHREIKRFIQKAAIARGFQNSNIYVFNNMRSRRSQIYDSIPPAK